MEKTQNEKTQYTTRLSRELLGEVQKIANQTGASTNSVFAMLVALGLKVYTARITVELAQLE